MIGKVINFEGVKYVSLKINIIQNVSDLLDDRKWLEISDRTNGYDLPIYDEDEAMATLIGVDNNENGIRDDYETKIVLSELPQAVKDRALAAGKVYIGYANRKLERNGVYCNGSTDYAKPNTRTSMQN